MPTGGGTGGAAGGRHDPLFNKLQGSMRTVLRGQAAKAEERLKALGYVKQGAGHWAQPGEDISAGLKEASVADRVREGALEDKLYGAGASSRPGWGE